MELDLCQSFTVSIASCEVFDNRRLQKISKANSWGDCFSPQSIPEKIQATLRKYQIEGVHWLEKLRKMHLNGVLADDMGLGKTLQAIIAITQSKLEKRDLPSLIVCPTSLVYNWKEEFHKFNPDLKSLSSTAFLRNGENF